ncbi:hypothetical protein G9C98_003770 [Cotesia typhae]|uniref:Uncharacterized protein n=1 Tax=Cotesia typhae TaxID=2053667 RepID=A0A8J5QM11_9HYME|nr:hypothetical protein G9C98_003770 [Cotesia typhae]
MFGTMLGYKFILFTFVISCASAIDLPDFLQVCSRNDHNLNDCIRRSADYLKPYLVTGVPEYNIPSLQPLLLDDLVGEGHGVKCTCKNIKVFGAADYSVKYINADLAALEFRVDILLPHLYVEGTYEVDGKVLLLPVTGSGGWKGNFTNCDASVTFTASTDPDASGVKQFHIEQFDLKVTVGNGYLHFENLFNGDKTIGDLVNQAINANFNVFLREIMPLVEQTLAKTFRDIGNGIVNPFSYDQLFPM